MTEFTRFVDFLIAGAVDVRGGGMDGAPPNMAVICRGEQNRHGVAEPEEGAGDERAPCRRDGDAAGIRSVRLVYA